MRRFRKSSERVTLVLIGVAALAACGGGTEERRRDVYKSREDCLADWANKPEDCQPASEPRHSGLGYFYGPWYRWGGGSPRSRPSTEASPAPGSHAIGSLHSSSSVSRGGFGTTGHASGG